MTAREAAVAAEILRLAREELALEGAPPDPGEPLAGRLDSLLLLSLVVAVEDRFRVILTDDDTSGATTLADLARLVAARTEDAGLPATEGAPP
jgi:acyl carrier protein